MTVEIMNPVAKLPDEIEVRGAVTVPEEPAPGPTPQGEMPEVETAEAEPKTLVAGAEGSEVAADLPEVEPAGPETPVRKSKVATKRLKKAAKEVKHLGVDADVGGEEK